MLNQINHKKSIMRKNIMPQLKSILKKIPGLVSMKIFITSLFDKRSGTTRLNILEEFPAYIPASSGTYSDRSKLTRQSINNFAQALILANQSSSVEHDIISISSHKLFEVAQTSNAQNFKRIFDDNRSDKADDRHLYHLFYGLILDTYPNIGSVFEIGIRSNNEDVVSSMGRGGRPGASLHAFSRLLGPSAEIYGADIDERVLFSDGSIETFALDQLSPHNFIAQVGHLRSKIDLFIDDGLHSIDANLNSIYLASILCKPSGIIIIEDIALEAEDLWKACLLSLSQTYYCSLLKCPENLVVLLEPKVANSVFCHIKENYNFK